MKIIQASSEEKDRRPVIEQLDPDFSPSPEERVEFAMRTFERI
ncbi:MAG: hypothetical protein ACOCVE_01140 [Desulfovermiculus sp.]